MRYLFIFILVLLPGTKSFCRPSNNFLYTSNIRDTVKKSKDANSVFGTLKFRPFQVLACEVPVSFELYMLNKKSIQLQVGYIFKGPGSPRFGPDNTDINTGLLSYRISPLCNDGGINIKIEYRSYTFPLDNRNMFNKSFYYAPQLMYKYSYYNNQSHWIEGGVAAFKQIESKKSNVFGAGIMIGIQKIHRRFVVDWYTGCGFRVRNMKINISELHIGPRTEYPNTIKNYKSIYPFLNLGIKIGFEL